MVKLLSDVSAGLPSSSSTRIRPDTVGVFGTMNTWLPSFGVLAAKEDQLAPPFVDKSIFRLPTVPCEVQVMVLVSACVHSSLPLGDVTVTDTGGGTCIVKVLSDVSVGDPDRALILIRPDRVGVFGTTNTWLLSLAVLETSDVQLVPPLVVRSMFTFPARFWLVHATVCCEPCSQVSPPLGLVNIMLG